MAPGRAFDNLPDDVRAAVQNMIALGWEPPTDLADWPASIAAHDEMLRRKADAAIDEAALLYRLQIELETSGCRTLGELAERRGGSNAA